MLCVVVSADITELFFPEETKRKIYKKKSIAPFLFVDVPSVLYHYCQTLQEDDEDTDNEGEEDSDHGDPNLERLVIESNLGSLDSQLVHESVLRSYAETKKYHDFPWRLSGRHSRASTDFLMLTLCNMFCRPKDYFSRLTEIRLNGECINTRLNVTGGRGGNAAVQMMQGIAYSVPNLVTLDLSKVSSLSPECVVYLFYQVRSCQRISCGSSSLPFCF